LDGVFIGSGGRPAQCHQDLSGIIHAENAPSPAIARQKRWRTTDAAAIFHASRHAHSVLDCASPLALCGASNLPTRTVKSPRSTGIGLAFKGEKADVNG